jgi:hypothetical protein
MIAARGRALRHTLLQPVLEGGRRALRVREDAVGGQVVVPGLTWLRVTTAAAAVDCYRRAAKQRQQAATAVNGASSRSHCVFMVCVCVIISSIS